MEWDWLTTAQAWVHEQLRRLGVRPTGPPAVIKAWSRSCALMFPTEEGNVYFKAVPFYFAHEPALFQHLARCFPALIPKVLAIDTERRWFIAEGCMGQPLSRSQSPDLWERAIRSYAQLQIGISRDIGTVVALGCPVRSLGKLVAGIPLLVDNAISQDGILGLSGDETEQLHSASPVLERACLRLAGYRIPCTLEHGDFHAGNVLVSRDACSIIDWSDSSVSHPFFSLFAFLEHKKWSPWLPDSPMMRAKLCQAYLRQWLDWETWSHLNEALRLAQLLAPLHTALEYYHLEQLNISDRTPFKKSVPYYLRIVLARIRTRGMTTIFSEQAVPAC